MPFERPVRRHRLRRLRGHQRLTGNAGSLPPTQRSPLAEGTGSGSGNAPPASSVSPAARCKPDTSIGTHAPSAVSPTFPAPIGAHSLWTKGVVVAVERPGTPPNRRRRSRSGRSAAQACTFFIRQSPHAAPAAVPAREHNRGIARNDGPGRFHGCVVPVPAASPPEPVIDASSPPETAGQRSTSCMPKRQRPPWSTRRPESRSCSI